METRDVSAHPIRATVLYPFKLQCEQWQYHSQHKSQPKGASSLGFKCTFFLRQMFIISGLRPFNMEHHHRFSRTVCGMYCEDLLTYTMMEWIAENSNILSKKQQKKTNKKIHNGNKRWLFKAVHLLKLPSRNHF